MVFLGHAWEVEEMEVYVYFSWQKQSTGQVSGGELEIAVRDGSQPDLFFPRRVSLSSSSVFVVPSPLQSPVAIDCLGMVQQQDCKY
jgi:hypothetical protein